MGRPRGISSLTAPRPSDQSIHSGSKGRPWQAQNARPAVMAGLGTVASGPSGGVGATIAIEGATKAPMAAAVTARPTAVLRVVLMSDSSPACSYLDDRGKARPCASGQ